VTHLDRIIKLRHLLDEERNLLDIEVSTTVRDLAHKVTIVNLWSFQTREKIHDDVFEERDIVLQEFGNIHISQSSE
jgi:hypothetical protein